MKFAALILRPLGLAGRRGSDPLTRRLETMADPHGYSYNRSPVKLRIRSASRRTGFVRAKKLSLIHI